MGRRSGVLARLPGPLAGRVDFWRGRQKDFYPYGGPMNGQTARLEIVRAIIETCGVEQIIETGMYRGTTTEWFCQFGLPVFAAEIEPRYATFCRLRLARCPNVEIAPMGSLEALRRWAGSTAINNRNTLFYLDAHWRDHLPLAQELDLIRSNFSRWAIVVDDFKVPFDSGYGFDDYGPDRVLDIDFLEKTSVRSFPVFFPRVPARYETGWKRGCVVIACDETTATRIGRQPLLKRHC